MGVPRRLLLIDRFLIRVAEALLFPGATLANALHSYRSPT